MKKIFLALTIAGGLVAASAALAQDAASNTAPAEPKISFPIAELGGCNSKDECKAYCDDSTNAERCLGFAESRGMMSKKEIETARKFIGQTGPGGCTGSACREYCNDKEHFAECRAFAEKNGLIPPRGERPKGPTIDKDKEEAVTKLVEREGGPGGCKSKDACKAYCDDGAHVDECMDFAKKSGLMSDDQIEQVKKLMEQEGPGGCKGIACRDYCEDDSHAEECMAFAEQNGLMTKDERRTAQKFREAQRDGGPGGCKGSECRDYCDDPEHRQECRQFAEEHGLVPQDRRERGQGQDDQGQDGQERPEGRFEGAPGDGPMGDCGTPEECRAKFEASGRELPVGQEVRDMKDDRRQERPFDTTQGKPPFDDVRNKPPFDDDTSNVQRQRPTKEQEQQMRREFDRQGAEEQKRGVQMMQFNNSRGEPPQGERPQGEPQPGAVQAAPAGESAPPPGGGPGAVLLSGFASLLHLLGL